MDKRLTIFVKTLKERKLSLALAESITCGLAAHLLAGVPGTSEILKGSVVCYTPEVKHSLLDIPEGMIRRYSCESIIVTRALARRLPLLIAADIHAAVTGLASAGGSETADKPVGTVFFAVRYKQQVLCHEQRFRGTPLNIRKKACFTLYQMILEII